MNKNFLQAELIEAYLEGNLSKAEADAFETERRNSPLLDAAVIEFETLKKGIEEAGRQELRRKIAAWEQEAASSKRVPLALKWAAAFLIFAGIAMVVGLLLARQEENTLSLAESMFEPFDDITGERNSASPGPLDSLLIAYQSGDYLSITREFNHEPMLLEDERDLWDFYLAESFFAQKQYGKAAEILGSYSQRDHALFEVARFHYALALLLDGSLMEAKDLLQIIFTEKGQYRNEAEILLKQLDVYDDAGLQE